MGAQGGGTSFPRPGPRRRTACVLCWTVMFSFFPSGSQQLLRKGDVEQKREPGSEACGGFNGSGFLLRHPWSDVTKSHHCVQCCVSKGSRWWFLSWELSPCRRLDQHREMQRRVSTGQGPPWGGQSWEGGLQGPQWPVLGTCAKTVRKRGPRQDGDTHDPPPEDPKRRQSCLKSFHMTVHFVCQIR